MNWVEFLAAQPWVGRVGLCLLHFVWQGTLIAAVYALLKRSAIFGRGPREQYWLACATLALMAATPLATWAWMQPADTAAGAPPTWRRRARRAKEPVDVLVVDHVERPPAN